MKSHLQLAAVFSRRRRRTAMAIATLFVLCLLALPSARSDVFDDAVWVQATANSSSPLAQVARAASELAIERERSELVGAPPLSEQWKLLENASDDFDGKQLDSRLWSVYTGGGNQGVGRRDASAVSVDGGKLQVAAKDKDKVSGGLSQNVNQTYGRWVIRARMDQGQGYGPAILLWPQSDKWPQDGEIDLAEMPEAMRNHVHMTVHYGKSNKTLTDSALGDFYHWHTFAVDWAPDRLVFYVDGAERYRVTDPAAIPKGDMHLALQNDLGACGSWIGCRSSGSPNQTQLHIGGVRVYRYVE